MRRTFFPGLTILLAVMCIWLPAEAQNTSTEPQATPPSSQAPFRQETIGTTGTDAQDDEEQLTRIGIGPAQSRPKRLKIQRGILMTLTASDNPVRALSGEKRNGLLLDARPYLNVVADAKDSFAAFYARAIYQRAFALTDGMYTTPQDGFGGSVSLGSDLSIAGDVLRLQANGFLIKGESLIARQLETGEVGLRRNDYARLSLRPYSKGRIGASHEYRLGYKAVAVRPERSIDQSTTQRVDLQVGTSGFSRAGFGWSARLDAGHTDYRDGREFESGFSEVLVDYLVSNQLRLGVGAYLAAVDILEDENGNNSGVGPSLVAEWRPSRRTGITARYASAYFGDVASLSWNYQAGNWLSRLSYRQGLESANDAGALFFEARENLGFNTTGERRRNRVAQGLIDRNVVLAASVPLSVEVLQSALVYERTLHWTVGYLSRRAEALWTFYVGDLEGAIAQDNGQFELSRRAGIKARFGYSLTRRSRLIGGLDATRFESGAAANVFEAFGAYAGWRYALTRQSAIQFTAKTAFELDELNAGERVRENSLSAELEYRF